MCIRDSAHPGGEVWCASASEALHRATQALQARPALAAAVLETHQHYPQQEEWSTPRTLGDGRLCRQRCACGAHRDVIWPAYSPGCEPTQVGQWAASPREELFVRAADLRTQLSGVGLGGIADADLDRLLHVQRELERLINWTTDRINEAECPPRHVPHPGDPEARVVDSTPYDLIGARATRQIDCAFARACEEDPGACVCVGQAPPRVNRPSVPDEAQAASRGAL